MNRKSLTLLELPSIFVPEDWPFTFFEGISRHPDIGFRNRDVTKLGWGNGLRWPSDDSQKRYAERILGIFALGLVPGLHCSSGFTSEEIVLY